MSFRELNRQKTWLLPPTLDELIPDDHPARFVSTVVDSLNQTIWSKLGISLDGEPLGAPAYHPRALLGVWLYGFMTGTRSSRKLEAACRDQLPYLWLTGWQYPDHNTLWRFYKEHRKEMRQLFKITVKTAVKLDLVDLAVQAIDGTKLSGNASRDRTYDAKGLKRIIERTDEIIQELERENDSGNDPSPVHLPEKLRKAKQLQEKVKSALVELEKEEQPKRVNLSDKDANIMKSRHGIIAGYNLESVASPLKANKTKKTGMLLTGIEVVPNPEDYQQLVPMLKQSEETTGQIAGMTLADAGYHSGSNLAACERRQQRITMPGSQDRRLKNPYHKDNFIYTIQTDSYTCPEGQVLQFLEIRSLGAKKEVRVYGGLGKVCRHCPAFGTCTKSRYRGREVLIGQYDAELRRHRAWMETDEAKTIFKQRKEIIEPVFGIMKEQMGVRRFLLRGLGNVQAEAVTLATAFNLRILYGIWRQWTSEKRNLIAITIQKTVDSLFFNIFFSTPFQTLSFCYN